MGILKIIDKKTTFQQQKNFLKSFFYIGMPVGYLFGQGLNILLFDWAKYNFNIYVLINHIITCLIIISPLIINYFKYTKMYKLIIEKHNKKTLTYKVKSKIDFRIYDRSIFTKDKIYDIQIIEKSVPVSKIRNYHKLILLIDNDQWKSTYNFIDFINKFEIVDIKEERKKKLEKLNLI